MQKTIQPDLRTKLAPGRLYLLLFCACIPSKSRKLKSLTIREGVLIAIFLYSDGNHREHIFLSSLYFVPCLTFQIQDYFNVCVGGTETSRKLKRSTLNQFSSVLGKPLKSQLKGFHISPGLSTFDETMSKVAATWV